MIRTLIRRFNKPVIQQNWAAEVLIAIPRWIAGLLLTLDFGASKFGMPWTDPEQGLRLFEVAAWFPEDVANFGVPFSWAPTFFAWMGAASEAIGGLFLLLGWKTRLSAFFIASTMLVAIFFQKWGQGAWPLLPALGFLWVAVYSLVLGSGRLGLDYWLPRWKMKTSILRLSLPLICSVIFLTGCATNTATVGIPPQEAFVLGELQDTKFKVTLKNLSDEIVQVKTIDVATGEQTSGFGLAARGKTEVYVDKNEKVILGNPSAVEVKVKAVLNRNVEGMRYEALERR